ncbi:MAG: WD40/YVTN/BNR-like repeat-containing protein [Sulfobacillus sp.]
MSVLRQTPGHALIQLFTSTNGGVSWVLKLSFSRTGTSGPGWFHLFSAKSGVMLGPGGNNVYLTANGGTTWTKRPAPQGLASPQSMSFGSPTHAWAIATSGAAGTDSAVVYRSTNGGILWQVIARTPSLTSTGPVPAGTLALSHGADSIYFKNDSVGWVTSVQFGSGYPWLYMSTDGGATWESQSLPLPKSWRSSEVTTYNPIFTSPTDGILPVAENSALYICQTTNGGKTWDRPLQVLPTSVSNNQSLTSFINPQGWVFASRQDGWAIVNNPYDTSSPVRSIWITTDGGQLWNRFTVTGGMAQISKFASGPN